MGGEKWYLPSGEMSLGLLSLTYYHEKKKLEGTRHKVYVKETAKFYFGQMAT